MSKNLSSLFLLMVLSFFLASFVEETGAQIFSNEVNTSAQDFFPNESIAVGKPLQLIEDQTY